MTGSREFNVVMTMSNLPTLKKLLNTRSDLLDLKMRMLTIQIQLLLRKYRPDQPRVPAGRPTGGQWTDGDDDTGTLVVAGKYDPARAELCDAQLLLDEELCRIAGSSICWSLSMDRHSACMKGNFVPKLRF